MSNDSENEQAQLDEAELNQEDSQEVSQDDFIDEMTTDEPEEISEETLEEMSQQRGIFDVPLHDLDLAELKTVSISETVGNSLKFMQDNKVPSLLILDGEKLAGIISERDFIVHVGVDLKDSLEKPISEFMTPNPATLSVKDSVKTAIEFLTSRNFRNIPLVDENNRPQFLLSITDLLIFISKAFKDSIESYGTITDWRKDGVFIPTESFQVSDHVSQEELIRKNIFIAPIRKVMNRDAAITDIGTSMPGIVDHMNMKKQGVVVLTRYETELEGIITQKDFLFKFLGKFDLSDETVDVEQFMTKNPHCLLESHVIAQAINNMAKFKYRNLVVVDKEGFPLSVVTLMDILNYIADFLRHNEDESES